MIPDTVHKLPPPPVGGLDPRAICRNGVPPSASGARALAGFFHHNAGYRLKVLGQFSQMAADCTSTDASIVVYRTLCHTSPNCDRIGVHLTIAPTVPTIMSEIQPTVTLVSKVADISTQPATLASVTTQATVTYARGKATAIVPDDLVFEYREFSLTADTTYALELSTEDYARVVGCTIFEIPRLAITSAANLALDTSRWRQGGPIFDLDDNDLLYSVHEIWKRGGRSLIRWSNLAGSYMSRASATPSNILDADVGAWAAQAPGFYIHVGDCGSLVGAADPVVCWTYAGLSAAGSNGQVSFRRSGATIKDVSVAATAGYYTNTSTIPSTTADYKVDIFAGGNGTQSVQVRAAGMFEYLS